MAITMGILPFGKYCQRLWHEILNGGSKIVSINLSYLLKVRRNHDTGKTERIGNFSFFTYRTYNKPFYNLLTKTVEVLKNQRIYIWLVVGCYNNLLVSYQILIGLLVME